MKCCRISPPPPNVILQGSSSRKENVCQSPPLHPTPPPSIFRAETSLSPPNKTGLHRPCSKLEIMVTVLQHMEATYTVRPNKKETRKSSYFSTDIESFIIYHFNCSKVQFIFFHLTPKLSCNAHAWPSKNNLNFNVKIRLRRINGYGLYVQGTAECSNALAKGWFISIHFALFLCHACLSESLYENGCMF